MSCTDSCRELNPQSQTIPMSWITSAETSKRERGENSGKAIFQEGRGEMEENKGGGNLSRCLQGNTLHSREGRHTGGRRELRKEGRRMSLHSSKLHWVTHPLLQLWLHATTIKHLHPTGRKGRGGGRCDNSSKMCNWGQSWSDMWDDAANDSIICIFLSFFLNSMPSASAVCSGPVRNDVW